VERSLRAVMPSPRAVLQSRRWCSRKLPFPYLASQDIFVPAFYDELVAAFQAVLDNGLSEIRTSHGFSRAASGYDAYIHSLPPNIDGPLAFFASRGWHDVLATVTNVKTTDDLSVALHHHEPHSKDGIIHNDLNPGWFVSRPRIDGINLADGDACNYNRGTPHASGTTPFERTRAVAMIFFLNNGEWRNGDGGECGLYTTREGSAEPAARIAPIDNSLVVFECTPHSFHRYMGNGQRTRDSVILWLHREKRDVVERWGERAIVKWTR
jgi:hypothetical protein